MTYTGNNIISVLTKHPKSHTIQVNDVIWEGFLKGEGPGTTCSLKEGIATIYIY